MHLFLALCAMWIVCSAHGGIFYLAGGLVACFIVVSIARRMGLHRAHHIPLYFHPRTWRYIGWLFLEILISGVEVTRILLRRELRLAPMLGWVTASQRTELGLAMYANSITLTPGTVSIAAEKGRLRVHALDKTMFHTLMEEQMDTKITKELKL